MELNFRKVKIKNSSAIVKMYYDINNQFLKVYYYNSEKYYIYKDVTLKEVAILSNLKDDQSLGKFFYKVIKSRKYSLSQDMFELFIWQKQSA